MSPSSPSSPERPLTAELRQWSQSFRTATPTRSEAGPSSMSSGEGSSSSPDPAEHPPADSFALRLKTLDATVHTVSATHSMLVSELKAIASPLVGLPVARQRLVFAGRVLKDEHSLSVYRLSADDAHVHVFTSFHLYIFYCAWSCDAILNNTNRSSK